jgi:hypothetical protein
MFFSLSLGRLYGIDSIIELLIIIVAGIISLYSHKIYKILQDKNYRFFSWAFLFIAISFVFKIVSNFTVLQRIRIQGVNFVYTVLSQPSYMPIVDFACFTIYKIFYLLGFLMLFLIITKTDKKDKIFLYIYLSIITILFSIYFNFVFHITIILILLFLVMHFYENHKNHRTTNSLLVLIAFLILLFSHLFMIFSDMDYLDYILAEGLMLIGFLSLLINQIKIKLIYNNGKKKQTGSNKRYLRNTAKK